MTKEVHWWLQSCFCWCQQKWFLVQKTHMGHTPDRSDDLINQYLCRGELKIHVWKLTRSLRETRDSRGLSWYLKMMLRTVWKWIIKNQKYPASSSYVIIHPFFSHIFVAEIYRNITTSWIFFHLKCKITTIKNNLEPW